MVDTNVFISASFKEASWPAAVVRWVEGSGGLLKTRLIEQEVFEVLRRPRIARNVSSDFVNRVQLVLLAPNWSQSRSA